MNYKHPLNSTAPSSNIMQMVFLNRLGIIQTDFLTLTCHIERIHSNFVFNFASYPHSKNTAVNNFEVNAKCCNSRDK